MLGRASHHFGCPWDRQRSNFVATRLFNRIKHFRQLATRYEKHAANFLAMLKLAAVHLWLRHNESVT